MARLVALVAPAGDDTSSDLRFSWAAVVARFVASRRDHPWQRTRLVRRATYRVCHRRPPAARHKRTADAWKVGGAELPTRGRRLRVSLRSLLPRAQRRRRSARERPAGERGFNAARRRRQFRARWKDSNPAIPPKSVVTWRRTQYGRRWQPARRSAASSTGDRPFRVSVAGRARRTRCLQDRPRRSTAAHPGQCPPVERPAPTDDRPRHPCRRGGSRDGGDS